MLIFRLFLGFLTFLFLKPRNPPKTYYKMIQSNQTPRAIYLEKNSLRWKAHIELRYPTSNLAHMGFSLFSHLFEIKAPKTADTLRTPTWPLIDFYFPRNSVYGMLHTKTAYTSIEWNTCPVVPRFYSVFSRESSIKSRLGLCKIDNLPAWGFWLTISNPNWSTIKSYICNHPITSYGSQYPTGHGPLYIDSDISFFPNHPNFQPKIFHMKNWEITYEILGYF
jgi:hypothetical protein